MWHLLLLFVNSFQLQRTKPFLAVFEKVHLAVVQERLQFMYGTKAKGLSRLQDRNIKILHSVDILVVFKNTKWPTCVYMIKNITQTVVICF